VKFICPECSTRYAVAEERPPEAKVLRFACKRCGHVIRLHNDEATRAPGMPVVFENVRDYSVKGVQITRVAPTVQMAALRHASNPKRASRAQEMEESAKEKPTSGEATRIASVEEVSATLEASAQAAQSRDERWYYLVRGERLGPVEVAELVGLKADQKINDRTHLWKKGMHDWQRLSELPELLARLTPGALSTPDPSQAETVVATALPALLLSSGAPTRELDALEFSAEQSAPVELSKPIATDGSEPVMLDTPVAQPVAKDAAPPARLDNPRALDDYLQAPPGDSTRAYITTAGLYKRRRNHRISMVVAALCAVAVLSVLGLDYMDRIRVPGMGFFYDVTGVADPNAGRAVARVEDKLSSPKLHPAERARLESLRQQLLGVAPRSRRAPAPVSAPLPAASGATTQVASPDVALTAKDHELAVDVFADKQKNEAGIKLSEPGSVEPTTLPAGLSQEAIFAVISGNSRAMGLCLAESMRKGEKLSGKMEIELTIEATGRVTDASILSGVQKSSVMATCTLRRVKGWRFPRFTGESVTVVYPYILQAAF